MGRVDAVDFLESILVVMLDITLCVCVRVRMRTYAVPVCV